MRTVQHALMLVFYVASAVVCIAIYQTRLGLQTAHAVAETRPFLELRGTISPDAPNERQIISSGTAQQASFDASEILHLLMGARTTGDVLQLHSSILLENQSPLDQISTRQLNAMFAAELDRRQEQEIKSEIARAARRERPIDWAVIASFTIALASGFSALGIWFSGYFNCKNYLYTVAKDGAAKIVSPKMA